MVEGISETLRKEGHILTPPSNIISPKSIKTKVKKETSILFYKKHEV